MKKALASCAALSIALLACADNSSSNSGPNLLGSNASHGINLTMGKCLDNGLGLAKEAESDELDKAYLVQGADYCQIMVPALNDYCDVDAPFKSKRSGDTLEIYFKLEEAAVTSCMCMKDHWFDISCGDADAKYFKYSYDVFKIVDEPAPISPEPEDVVIPNAPEFDESDPHQHTTDVIGKCDWVLDDAKVSLSSQYINIPGWNDLSERNGEQSISLAKKYEDESDAAVLVFETGFDCDEYVSSVNVFVSNDTLFVKPQISKDESVKLAPGEGCACYTNAAFKLENEGIYADAKYMVFGNHMENVYTLKPETKE